MYIAPSTQLYEPLRTTLDKSIVNNSNNDITKSRVFQSFGATSRVSKTLRPLSPEQANYIKNSTNLPIDKNLVPTNNLWKIQGKQFSAVDVTVRQGPPIPASMIRIPPGIKGGRITTQTLYEIQPRQSHINVANTRSITNLRTVFPPTNQPINYPSNIMNPSSTSLDVRRPASPVRVSSNINPAFILSPNNQYQIPAPRPVNSMNIDKRTGATSSDSWNQEPKPNTTKRFDKYEKAPQSSKSKYKYNFFSALDQAVNTKCGSCGSNQIIASKPLSSWE